MDQYSIFNIGFRLCRVGFRKDKDKLLSFQSVSKENAELKIGFGLGSIYRGIN
ncbi:hypothetical protein D1AOALGA4SA_10712 [Olavius algarvensis Delta 1 endosymbiont]|nr:hypothetical protein D1AOALGA4SA_10712 [Olavius algarvensis Delta 1 endosymbiont]